MRTFSLLEKYLEILFFQYLSYHPRPDGMIIIKRKILKNFKLTENQFDRLIWRTNRVLIFLREYNRIESTSDDKTIQSRTYNNYIRQFNYFRTEVNDIVSKNKNEFEFTEKDMSYIEEILNIEENSVKAVMSRALYPPKNPLLNPEKGKYHRFYNSGTYFEEI